MKFSRKLRKRIKPGPKQEPVKKFEPWAERYQWPEGTTENVKRTFYKLRTDTSDSLKRKALQSLRKQMTDPSLAARLLPLAIESKRRLVDYFYQDKVIEILAELAGPKRLKALLKNAEAEDQENSRRILLIRLGHLPTIRLLLRKKGAEGYGDILAKGAFLTVEEKDRPRMKAAQALFKPLGWDKFGLLSLYLALNPKELAKAPLPDEKRRPEGWQYIKNLRDGAQDLSREELIRILKLV